ncbi:MAG: serine hydrolase [Caulobacterales bacterium]|nr:serine hydrolase [Caulobacterales bacterium]
MRVMSRRSLLAGTCALAACASVNTSERTGNTVTALLAARIDDQHRGSGGAIAVARNGVFSFASHGVTRIDGGAPISADTTFQIASLTKVFTAFLFADAVERGEVALDEPLIRDAPQLVHEGRAITLLDLATHTSGLPLRPISRVDRSQDNPYAGYSPQELQADIAAIRLGRTPGERFEYSNFGYALLGWALAERAGRPYATLLEERILRPLRMTSTTLSPSDETRARLVQGYNGDWAPMQPWDFGALAPAGGLFSTIADLQKFLSLWSEEHGRMSAIARSMLTPARPGADAETRMALGWRVRTRNGRSIAWSNGSGGGVRSFLATSLDDRSGVIAFANMATGIGVDDIGFRALDPNEPVDVAPIPVRVAIGVAPAALDRYVGAYAYAPDDTLTIVRAGDGLAIQQGGQLISLYAETERLFFIREDNVTLEFAPAETGLSPALTLTQQGQSFLYARQ